MRSGPRSAQLIRSWRLLDDWETSFSSPRTAYFHNFHLIRLFLKKVSTFRCFLFALRFARFSRNVKIFPLSYFSVHWSENKLDQALEIDFYSRRAPQLTISSTRLALFAHITVEIGFAQQINQARKYFERAKSSSRRWDHAPFGQ